MQHLGAYTDTLRKNPNILENMSEPLRGIQKYFQQMQGRSHTIYSEMEFGIFKDVQYVVYFKGSVTIVSVYEKETQTFGAVAFSRAGEGQVFILYIKYLILINQTKTLFPVIDANTRVACSLRRS
jgi:hypothetical protein